MDVSPVHSMPASPDVDSSPEEITQFDVLDSAVLSSGVLDASDMGQLQLKNNTAIINMSMYQK